MRNKKQFKAIEIKNNMSGVSNKEGSLDDFIDTLVSAPPQNPNSISLDIDTDNYENLFKVLIEIFTKSMKYVYGDNMGRVNLDELGQSDLDLMSKYFGSFGFKLFVERVEGNNNKTSYGATENQPVKDSELKAQCLRIQTNNNLYVIYFDFLRAN